MEDAEALTARARAMLPAADSVSVVENYRGTAPFKMIVKLAGITMHQPLDALSLPLAAEIVARKLCIGVKF